MTNVKREFRFDSTHHPSDAELIDYLGGRSVPTSHEEIQSHLVECDQCLELFKNVRDFFEAHRENEQMVTEDIAHEWKALWNRIKDEEKTEALPPAAGRERRWLDSWMSLGFAAMLLVVVAIGAWAVRERRLKQQLSRELDATQQQSTRIQAEQQNLAVRNKQLEQEKLELEERMHSMAQSQGSQPVGQRKPEMNVPIYDLYARNFNRRSGEESAVNRIKVPSIASSIVLILNAEGVADSSSYEIEILGSNGQVIWRGKGLKKGHLGNFTITLDRAFLGKGIYQLRVYGQNAFPRRAVAEYLMRIE